MHTMIFLYLEKKKIFRSFLDREAQAVFYAELVKDKFRCIFRVKAYTSRRYVLTEAECLREKNEWIVFWPNDPESDVPIVEYREILTIMHNNTVMWVVASVRPIEKYTFREKNTMDDGTSDTPRFQRDSVGCLHIQVYSA